MPKQWAKKLTGHFLFFASSKTPPQVLPNSRQLLFRVFVVLSFYALSWPLRFVICISGIQFHFIHSFALGRNCAAGKHQMCRR